MAESDPHPIAHVAPELLHQWMREECASLAAARQAREDNVVSTIIQIGAAALLGVPALLLSSDVKLEISLGGIGLAIGLTALAIAVSSGFLEQHFSGKAYERQRELVIAYYQQVGTEQIDVRAVQKVPRARLFAYWCFSAGALISMLSLLIVKAESSGKASLASTPAASTSTSAAAAAAAAAGNVRREHKGRNAEVSAIPNSAAAAD